MSKKKVILAALVPMIVFGVSAWMITIPGLHMFGLIGLWLTVAMGVFGVFVAIWAVFKNISNRNAAPGSISSNQLWLIRLLVLGAFVSAILHTLSEGLTLLTIVQYGVAGYGVYWLRSHPKPN